MTSSFFFICIYYNIFFLGESLTSFLFLSHSLTQQPCTGDYECAPVDYPTVPSDLVSCVDGACLCLRCFTPNTTSGQCVLQSPCFGYNNSTDTCIDNRKSQETALLLSIFLSSTGAANLYIGQYVLGWVQLSLLAILLLSLCTCFGCGCCIICCDDEFEDCCDCYDGESVFICLFLFLLFVVCLVSFAIIFWWAVDLAVFSLNDRPDGNGCSLKYN